MNSIEKRLRRLERLRQVRTEEKQDTEPALSPYAQAFIAIVESMDEGEALEAVMCDVQRRIDGGYDLSEHHVTSPLIYTAIQWMAEGYRSGYYNGPLTMPAVVADVWMRTNQPATKKCPNCRYQMPRFLQGVGDPFPRCPLCDTPTGLNIPSPGG